MDYRVGIENMIRSDLEEYALQVTHSLEILEEENERLSYDLSTSAKIDPEVIDRWRQWIDRLEEERAALMDLSTKTSVENNQLRSQVRESNEAMAATLVTLETIGKIIDEKSDPKKKTVTLIRVMEQIKGAVDIEHERLSKHLTEDRMEVEDTETAETAEHATA